MKNFWQIVIRYRVIMAALSILALGVTLWLRNAPTPAGPPHPEAEMPAAAAMAVESSVTVPATSGDAVPQAETSLDSGVSMSRVESGSTIRASSQEGTVPAGSAAPAPAVQRYGPTSFESSNPHNAPYQSLLNDAPGEKVGKTGPQF